MQNLKIAISTITMLAAFLVMPLHPARGQACTCAGSGIRSEEAPPPLPEYDQPPVPGPGYLWTPGYWAWNNVDYYWVPGTWVEPPRPGLLWTPGYWGFVNGVYAFNQGYWGPQVGFYGGIAYGFGYTGLGYQGGRWTNGTFFYNSTVNNITNTSIANVYNQTVVSNNAAGRASVNGGPGGTVARPTAEEEAASREPHEGPTSQQRANVRAASLNEGSFASANHGIPAVAATRQPGNLKGPGVVQAKEAALPKSVPPAAEGKPLEEHNLPSAPSQPATHGPAAEPKPTAEQTRTAAPQEQKTPETGSKKAETRPESPASVPHASKPEAPHAAQAQPKDAKPKAEPAQHAASPKPAGEKPKPAPEH